MTVVERHQLVPGYVLHVRAYRETSALVNLFTSSQGRVALVARGARRPRSGLRALLQPFAPLLLSWSSRGDLGTLGSAERAMATTGLRAEALLSGMYLNELLMRLTQRHDPLPEVFTAYAATLDALSQVAPPQTEAMEAHLRDFEVTLLRNLGYGLSLTHEAEQGTPVDASRRYHYRPQFGATAAAGPVPRGALEITGDALLALDGQLPWDPSRLRQAKRLMRSEIDGHLGDRPLNSRSLFRSGPRR